MSHGRSADVVAGTKDARLKEPRLSEPRRKETRRISLLYTGILNFRENCFLSTKRIEERNTIKRKTRIT